MSVLLRVSVGAGAALVLSCGSPGGVAQPMVTSLHDCPAVACLHGASYRGDIQLGGADPAQLEIRACRNASCVLGTLVPLNRAWYECSGDPSLSCGLNTPPDRPSGSMYLRLGPPRGVDAGMFLKEGDVYEVTIGVPAERPLLRLQATAGYRLNYASDPGCGLPCKSLSLNVAE